jgi:BirA family biotin operon repressor/biotin-[acetyl-CoA-carboxylase] ligase
LSLPLTIQLLRLLCHREFRSGQDLARAAGRSRARVCQALNDAEALGVHLHRLPGKGYRLASPLSLLDPPTIQAALPPGNPFLLEVVDEIGSTNSALLTALQRGEDVHGRVLAAERQTAGRGRMGREWVSRFGGSLTFSFGWRFEQCAAALSGLSLAIGVALAQGLGGMGYGGVRLKWPNDLLHTHRKLGGVLLEIAGDALGPTTVVVGVGINVALPAAARVDIPQAVVDLSELADAPPDRNRLLAGLLTHLAPACEQFGKAGFRAFADISQGLHAYHGRPVRLSEPGGAVSEGVVEGVDETGALLFSSQGARRRLLAGEISLRRMA